jgi:diguanylate cyclase (GGDEF)-like protein
MSTPPAPAGQQQPHIGHSKGSGGGAAGAFWRLMHQVALVAGATHVMFLGLFYGLGATTLAWVNLGSVLLFAASYVCLRVRRNLAATVLVLIEILVHAVLAVRAIGWDSGFHYYLLVVVPIVVISKVRWALLKPALIGLMMTVYMVMDYAMRDLPPLHLLDARTLSGLRYFNISVTFLLLAYLSGLYLRLVNKAEEQLRVLATTDPLTQLLNRRSLLERADYEIKQRQRHPQPLAFVLADIDHFKSINDQHGHAAGDAVLTAVSQALRQTVREQDSVARWGGEEFLILMPQATMEAASAVAERLRASVAAVEVPIEGQRIQVTMTFGVSTWRPNEMVDTAIIRADVALYQGKQAGRNQVVPEAS